MIFKAIYKRICLCVFLLALQQNMNAQCVTPTITIVANPPAFCSWSGATSTLTASGATSYTWSVGPAFTPTLTVTPTMANNSFTVVGSSGTCVAVAVVQISVESAPSVTLTANPSAICAGTSSTLTATGANSYTWANNPSTNSVIVVSPTADTGYTVTGFSSVGCTGSVSIGKVSVDILHCVTDGLEENSIHTTAISVWPNPNNGHFTFSANKEATFHLINGLGQELKKIALTGTNNYTYVIENLEEGIYFLVGDGKTSATKIVVTK